MIMDSKGRPLSQNIYFRIFTSKLEEGLRNYSYLIFGKYFVKKLAAEPMDITKIMRFFLCEFLQGCYCSFPLLLFVLWVFKLLVLSLWNARSLEVKGCAYCKYISFLYHQRLLVALALRFGSFSICTVKSCVINHLLPYSETDQTTFPCTL